MSRPAGEGENEQLKRGTPFGVPSVYTENG